MNNNDYVFFLNWEDRYQSSHKVGFLAQIDKFFYFIVSEPKNAALAYEKGFIGVPGFESGEIYRSGELFDFFKSRILEKDSQNPCEELAESKGVSMVDSFSLEEVTEKDKERYKKSILEIYRIHLQKKQLRDRSEQVAVLRITINV